MTWLGSSIIVVVVTTAASVFYYYFKTGVPPVPARSREVADILRLLATVELPPRPVIYELGCGWGTLMAALARAYPQAEVIGAELSPLPWLVARLRCRSLANAQVLRTDYHQLPLERADAVTCYLMIKPMQPLADLLDAKLRPETPVISLAFWFRNRRPAQTNQGGKLGGDVALYRWPARQAPESSTGPAG